MWTLDFKGWFRTADGQRCDPLTIRDLGSRYLLCVSIVAEQSDACVRRVMTGLFKRLRLAARDPRGQRRSLCRKWPS